MLNFNKTINFIIILLAFISCKPEVQKEIIDDNDQGQVKLGTEDDNLKPDSRPDDTPIEPLEIEDINGQDLIISFENKAIRHGGIIHIKGDGFGIGPNIELFDTFNNQNDEIIKSTAAIGEFDGADISNIIYKAAGNSERIGPALINTTSTETSFHGLSKEFSGPVTEVYFSYWVYVPKDKKFPWRDLTNASCEPTAGQLPNCGSSFKMAWIMLGSKGGISGNDICLPTFPDGGFTIAGNDGGFLNDQGNRGELRPGSDTIRLGTDWWDWNDWMRFSIWMKADQNSPTSPNAKFKIRIVNSKGGLVKSDTGNLTQLFDLDHDKRSHNCFDYVINNANFGPTVFPYEYQHCIIDKTYTKKAWDRIKIPGWAVQAGPNIQVLYDDIYIATGENSQARIEIANNIDYDQASKISTQILQKWTNDDLSANLNIENFSNDEILYLFITLGNGTRNREGIKIK